MDKKKHCYHCNFLILNNVNYFVVINKKKFYTCCPGCRAVLQTIFNSGLYNYYKFRSKFNNRISVNVDFFNKISLFDTQTIKKSFINSTENYNSITLMIEGITCSACIWLIEQSLLKLKGLHKVSISINTYQAVLFWDPKLISLSEIIESIFKIGYKSFPYNPEKQELLNKNEFKYHLKCLGLSAIGMMQVMMFAVATYFSDIDDVNTNYKYYMHISSLIVTTPVMFYSGYPFFINAYRGIKQKCLGMDVTVSIALFLSYTFSVYSSYMMYYIVYYDSVCMFIFLLTLSRFFKMCARHHSYNIFNKTINSNIEFVTLIKRNFESIIKDRIISVFDIKINDLLLIKPGENIPADGVLIKGNGFINESMLTGEKIPSTKTLGDSLYCYTQNISSPILMKVTSIKENYKISHIRRLVENAQNDRPNIVDISNKFSTIFVLFVLFTTFFVWLFWYYFNPELVFEIVISVLVVTCPCALSLATPMSLTISITALMKLGFLITKGNVIEGLTQLTHVVFDKTGTLTRGSFYIKKIIILNNNNKNKVLSIAYCLEKYIGHPIANAFLKYLNNFSYNLNIDSIKLIPNKGVEGIIDDKIYRIGKKEFVFEIYKGVSIIKSPNINGHWILLGSVDEIFAWFELSDSIREDAKITVDSLIDSNLNLHILSGDSSKSVKVLAKYLNIKHVYNNINFEKKLKHIKILQKKGNVILMVGDGVNDAAALSVSQISVSMGTGTDLAKTSSDVVLLNDKLYLIPIAICHAKKTKTIILQNLIWSCFYNFTMLPLAITGNVKPYFAAFGMSFSSLLVILNSFRLYILNKK